MKKLQLLLLLALLFTKSSGQTAPPAESPARFVVFLQDTSLITTSSGLNGLLSLTAGNEAIQAVLNNYTIYKFEPRSPDSRYPVMRQYYWVEANSLALLDDLLQFPSVFPYGAPDENIPTYTPNDYYTIHSDEGWDLELVRAREAWDITHGDPDLVIGISDTRFETTHPDLQGKIAMVFSNNSGTSDHGTSVAGYAAGATDNGIGLPAMGFNCRLGLTLWGSGTGGMVSMSASGLRVLNASWAHISAAHGDCDNWYSYAHFADQVDCGEIYENGAIAFFGAANGPGWHNGCGTPGVNDTFDVHSYAFPSSLDHNMSISTVGHRHDIGHLTFDGTNYIPLNWKKVHQYIAGDSLNTFHHNDRVDLVAPGYGVQTLTTAANGYYKIEWGTSFSSPMCAGAAGLILSAPYEGSLPGRPNNYCLSPYQIEWVMKTTADASIYDIEENEPYIGRLGAGLLNAFASVDWVNSRDVCNDPDLRTFIVKGVELNTICAPGFSSNGINPTLVPVLADGVPPYTYRWEPFPDNTTTLNNTSSATPTITASTGTRIAHYYLTVYDSSPIQKVANKVVRIQLRTSGWDLAMRDLYMDMLDEPNTMATYDPRTFGVWKSPDIWNRWAADGIYEHQNPEFFTTNNNYMYVKVRNVGCTNAPATAKLKMYWTMASTTELWPTDWDGTSYYPGTSLPLGEMITPAAGISIPSLVPGQTVHINQGWSPPNPTDYITSATKLETCLLARIEESSTTPYGMTIPELLNTPVSYNVINNNNIVTHNTWTYNLHPGNMTQSGFVFVGNPASLTGVTKFTLQLVNEKHINKHIAGDMSSVITTKVYLGDDLYAKWAAGGYQGTYASKNDATKEVIFDGMNMELQNIEIKKDELFQVKITFSLIPGAKTTDYSHIVHFRQISEDNTLRDPIFGNCTYEITTQKSEAARPQMPLSNKEVANTIGNYTLYPNPTKGNVLLTFNGPGHDVTLRLTDITGRLIYAHEIFIDANPQEVSLSKVPTGVYILTLTDKSGGSGKFKIVKQ